MKKKLTNLIESPRSRTGALLPTRIVYWPNPEDSTRPMRFLCTPVRIMTEAPMWIEVLPLFPLFTLAALLLLLLLLLEPLPLLLLLLPLSRDEERRGSGG